MRRYLLVLLLIAVLVASLGAVERERVAPRPPPLDVTGRYAFGEGADRCEVDFKRAEPLPILADGGSEADRPIGMAVVRRASDGRRQAFARLDARTAFADRVRVVWDDGTSCAPRVSGGEWQPIDCRLPRQRLQAGHPFELPDDIAAWGLVFSSAADLRRVLAARGPTWEEAALQPMAGDGGEHLSMARAFSLDPIGLALLEQEHAPLDSRLQRTPRSHRVITLLQRVGDCPAFVAAMRDSLEGMRVNGDVTATARDVLLGGRDDPLWLSADWKIPPDHRVRAVFHVEGSGLFLLSRYSGAGGRAARSDLDELALWRFDAPADPTDGDLVLRTRPRG